MGILRSSIRKGDEGIVAAVLPDVTEYEDDDRHNVVLNVVALLRKYPSGKWQLHAAWVYEHSPCSMCRAPPSIGWRSMDF